MTKRYSKDDQNMLQTCLKVSSPKCCEATLSTIPSMKWPATRPVTARHCRVCWSVTSSKRRAAAGNTSLKGRCSLLHHWACPVRCNTINPTGGAFPHLFFYPSEPSVDKSVARPVKNTLSKVPCQSFAELQSMLCQRQSPSREEQQWQTMKSGD